MCGRPRAVFTERPSPRGRAAVPRRCPAARHRQTWRPLSPPPAGRPAPPPRTDAGRLRPRFLRRGGRGRATGTACCRSPAPPSLPRTPAGPAGTACGRA
ncbi:hypothetical protein DESPIGER_1260 [Desulfovibrio piger]|uniref:Uncharacterized protein n=1 Tax=Desulfovibrio piger TaxID=901 RepID=A0A1K1LEI2_9BACT|nr:hypothetical protein DESPIGER_1260 [Desulfovibrio piger]